MANININSTSLLPSNKRGTAKVPVSPDSTSSWDHLTMQEIANIVAGLLTNQQVFDAVKDRFDGGTNTTLDKNDTTDVITINVSSAGSNQTITAGAGLTGGGSENTITISLTKPVAASFRRDGLRTITSNTTLTTADEGKFIACSGNITITLPDLSPSTDIGFFVRFVKSGSTGTVTIDPAGSGTVNGLSAFSLSNPLESVYLKYNGDSGSNNIWAVVSHSIDTNTVPTFIADKTAIGSAYVDISSDTYQDGDILAITAKETTGNIVPRTVIERWEDIIDGTWIYITFESGRRFQIRKSGNKLQAQSHVISSTSNKISVVKLN